MKAKQTEPADPPDATRDHTPSPEEHQPSRSPADPRGPGTLIGPYKLRQVLGEGGMGTVYLAEQEAPVRRVVALKIIKPGMDTEQVVARFEAEPGPGDDGPPSIAKVLDAGATDSGRPFFVMELVKGVPITDYCDTVHLTPKERLELFLPVCPAVQHAHQKGIIHRDIKPSNVLVAMQDGKPVPKVIDFGIAKATDQRLTEHTLFTQHGAIVGTLEYMSPSRPRCGRWTSTRGPTCTRSACCFTSCSPALPPGANPAAESRATRRSSGESRRKSRRSPSTRLSESSESLSSVAAQRKMEPARPTKLVRGDLDWIVMKAIEKDRMRRYATATVSPATSSVTWTARWWRRARPRRRTG